MSKVIKTAFIKADSKKVLDYIHNVNNHPAFISALKSVENVSGDSKQAGTNWEWTFVMGGVEVKGKAQTAEYVEGKRYSFKTTNGINSTFIYSVEPDSGGTKLTIEVDYEAPDNVLAKIMDKAVIERLNEQEGDRAAENLKAILEG
jgi:uncharacterized membrane protein